MFIHIFFCYFLYTLLHLLKSVYYLFWIYTSLFFFSFIWPSHGQCFRKEVLYLYHLVCLVEQKWINVHTLNILLTMYIDFYYTERKAAKRHGFFSQPDKKAKDKSDGVTQLGFRCIVMTLSCCSFTCSTIYLPLY